METIHAQMVVWEFRGSFPDIPTAPGIDIAELTQGDNDPFFVTLPIGRVNAESRYQRVYDEEFVNELARQAVDRRATGILGHLSAEDIRNYRFPPEAIHWVGVQRQNDMLWGKGYMPPGPDRERVRRYKALGKPMATSIFAKMTFERDRTTGKLRALANTLDLHQIDLGPVERAGVPELGAVPIITAEMDNNEVEDISMTDRVQVIREMSVDDVDLIPRPVREAIITAQDPPEEVDMVRELYEVLDLPQTGDVVETVKGLLTDREQTRQQLVDQRIRELVADIKTDGTREVVTELILAKGPATPDEAKTYYDEIVGRDSVKHLLATEVREMMGPNQTTRTQKPAGDGETTYFQFPEEDK